MERRIITGMAHGGHAINDNAPNAQTLSKQGWTKLSEVVQEPPGKLETTAFDYLFENLVGDEAAHLPAGTPEVIDNTVAALNELGDAMVEQEPPADQKNSPIPPIYTYWGQFVDHDMTAATDNDSVISIRSVPLPPLGPDEVRANLTNARHPALNLDSLYGNGPDAPPPAGPDDIVVPYQPGDRAKLQLGTLGDAPVGVRIPPVDDRERDLPRDTQRRALIGDGRNDENLVVAQLHVAFMKFHNKAVDWVRRQNGEEYDVFTRAQQLTMMTYQWLTVHDFLKTITVPNTVENVLLSDHDLLEQQRRGTYMPLEFSVAAYRFGHSMIRGTYDWNRNFGRPGNNTSSTATFAQMFAFTGTGGFRPAPTLPPSPALPDNWPAEWDRFVDKNSLFADRFARRIDTLLALPLSQMINQTAGQNGTFDVVTLLKHLARRNLLRGWRLGLPTGQAVAQSLGITPLTPAEVTGRDPVVAAAVRHGGFDTRTPLWFYVLREAEVKEQGNTLGELGSRIVAETIISQIRRDQSSFLNQGFTPFDGVRLPDNSQVDSIPQFLRFAGVL